MDFLHGYSTWIFYVRIELAFIIFTTATTFPLVRSNTRSLAGSRLTLHTTLPCVYRLGHLLWNFFFRGGGLALRVQLWDVGNDTLRNGDVSGLWKLTVLTSVVSFVLVLWFCTKHRVTRTRSIATPSLVWAQDSLLLSVEMVAPPLLCLRWAVRASLHAQLFPVSSSRQPPAAEPPVFSRCCHATHPSGEHRTSISSVVETPHPAFPRTR